jgi:hypothetical protein
MTRPIIDRTGRGSRPRPVERGIGPGHTTTMVAAVADIAPAVNA